MTETTKGKIASTFSSFDMPTTKNYAALKNRRDIMHDNIKDFHADNGRTDSFDVPRGTENAYRNA